MPIDARDVHAAARVGAFRRLGVRRRCAVRSRSDRDEHDDGEHDGSSGAHHAFLLAKSDSTGRTGLPSVGTNTWSIGTR